MSDLFEIRASQVADLLEEKLQGPNILVNGICSFENQMAQHMSFSKSKPMKDVPKVPASGALIITSREMVDSLKSIGYSVIGSDKPKYDFAQSVNVLMKKRPYPAIHPSVAISDRVRIAAGVSIGPFCWMDGDIDIGPGVSIGANVTLRNNVVIGEGASIKNGSCIGEDPYSFGFDNDYHSVRMPAAGCVRIGREVEIGNNVVISRGVFEDTILEDQVRVNDLAHIGNSTRIGYRTLIQANCDLSSRIDIGCRCWISQSVAVHQGVTVGDNCLVGMGAVVVRDIPTGSVAMGIPARVVRSRLPEDY